MIKPGRVLITGCSSGFGRLLVSEMLSGGWQVFATLRQLEQRRDCFVNEKRQWGDQLQVRELDVSSAEQRATIVKELGELGLDCLINNAGYGLFGALEDLTEEQYREQFEVNFFAVVFLTRLLLPTLRGRQGSLVFLSSVLGYSGMPLTGAYCASKYAVEGFAESLYHELTPHRTRVYLIEPGGHRTSFGQNVRWGEGRGAAFAGPTKNYQAMLASTLKRDGVAPKAVVRTIVRLIEGRSRRLRAPLGRDAWLLRALHHLIPEGPRHWLLHRLFRGLFWKQER
jgi:NAD(P)-dependent dehydrogenase (short-subunit alcohol dehydrogenase family)